MVFLLILFLIINQTESKANISKQNNVMHKIIQEFISSSTGINFYFCNPKDAYSTLKYYKNKPYTIKSQILLTENYIKDITITFLQPQILEIFLDLTCANGFKFLQQSSQLFNSSYRWLLWTDDYNQTLNQLHLSRVLLDSNVILAFLNGNSVIIYDLYKMHRSLPFTITEVKQWSSKGVTYPIAIPKRRHDFMGVNIVFSVVIRSLNYNQSNFVHLLMDPTYLPRLDVRRRFNLQLLFHVAEYYNFTTSFIYTRTWGTPDENGSYNGLVGQVQRDEAEMGGSYTLLLGYRTNTIDYLMHVNMARLSLVFLQPRTLGTYKSLTVPFEQETWALFFITVFVLILIMNIKRISEGNLSDKILIALSSISQQGAPENIATLSGKLFFLTLLTFSFLIIQYYSIALLSGFILPTPNAIQTWDQLMESHLKLGIEDDIYLNSDFHGNDTKSIQMRNKIANDKEKNIFFSFDEGLEKVRKEAFAFYNVILDNFGKIQDRLSDSEICSLSEMKKTEGPVGPVGQDNSPYKEHIRRIFQLLKENGIFKYQLKFWVPRKPVCHWKQEKVVISAKALTIAFIVFFIGVIASLIIFLLQTYIFKQKESPRPFIH